MVRFLPLRLLDSRSVAATAINSGALTATDIEYDDVPL